MRKLAAILAFGVAAAVPLLAAGGSAGAATACPPQSTYLPNQAATTANAALTAAIASGGLGSIAADGTFRITFTSSVCGGFRFVLRAKEIRAGNPGQPRHDGYTTLANVLVIIPAGAVTVNASLLPRGLDLLNYARSVGQSLTVFAIAHVRPAGTTTSSEAIQITTLK